MVLELRVNVSSVMRELDVAMRVLTEARIVSRYRRIFKGRGLEFEDFRNYTEDDDSSRIDWKASKRVNKLLIRQFKEERDMNVYFIVDVSSSMLFGSTKKLKYEYAAELVAALSHFILQSGDRIGLVMFTDKVVKYIEPAKGQDHFYVMLQTLLDPKYYGGRYNLSNAMNFVMRTATEKSLGFLITDFIGLDRNWERSMKLVSTKLDGVAMMVRDPRDRKLPSGVGQVVISDPFTGKEMLVDSNDESRMDYERYVARQEDHIRHALKESSWDLVELSTDESFIVPVIQFLKRREILFR